MRPIQDLRDKRMEDEAASLQSLLKSAGLGVKRTYARDDEEEISCLSDIDVYRGDGRVVARVRMATGSGWYSSFHGWTIKLPTYQPRGSYNQRERRNDPANPTHWGQATVQSTGAAVAKIIDAVGDIPTQKDIERGELLQEIYRKSDSHRDARYRAKTAFDTTNIDLMNHICSILAANGYGASKDIKEAVTKYRESMDRARVLSEKIDDLYKQVEKLEEQS